MFLTQHFLQVQLPCNINECSHKIISKKKLNNKNKAKAVMYKVAKAVEKEKQKINDTIAKKKTM